MAQVCDFIVIYMLYLKGENYNSKNISLYRDDGQALFKYISGSASEKKNYNLYLSKKLLSVTSKS